MLYNSFPYLTTPSSSPAISEDEARKWLRLETGVTDADSGLIQMCVTSAVGTFERFTGLQVMEADYTWMLGFFPVSIEKAPNIHDIVISYKLDKMDAGWTVLGADKYQFYQEGYRQNSIQYTSDTSLITPEIVKVTFKAGYDDASKIPPDWLMPIRAILAEVWDNRGDGVREKTSFSEKLMMNYAILAVR
jgi:hypothetical protein